MAAGGSAGSPRPRRASGVPALERGQPVGRRRPSGGGRSRRRRLWCHRRVAARCGAQGRSLARCSRAPFPQQGRAADRVRDRGIPVAGRVGYRSGSRVGGRRWRGRAGRDRSWLRPVRGRPPGALRGHLPAGRAQPGRSRARRGQRGGLRAADRDDRALSGRLLACTGVPPRSWRSALGRWCTACPLCGSADAWPSAPPSRIAAAGGRRLGPFVDAVLPPPGRTAGKAADLASRVSPS